MTVGDTGRINPKTGKPMGESLVSRERRSDEAKLVPVGDEKLFKLDEWVHSSELHGEPKVLRSPILHEAFNRVLEQHTPNQPTAFLSLCTATRPYYKSPKWKILRDKIGTKVDMIVVSSGGFVPEQFWESWPFQNYNAGVHIRDNEEYKKVMYKRMIKFFKNNKYKNVIVNFMKQQRNYKPGLTAMIELKKQGYVEDYIFLPTDEVYQIARSKSGQHNMIKGGKKGTPTAHIPFDPVIVDQLTEQVELYGYNEPELPKTIFEIVE